MGKLIKVVLPDKAVHSSKFGVQPVGWAECIFMKPNLSSSKDVGQGKSFCPTYLLIFSDMMRANYICTKAARGKHLNSGTCSCPFFGCTL
jgi:hypothetical protein